MKLPALELVGVLYIESSHLNHNQQLDIQIAHYLLFRISSSSYLHLVQALDHILKKHDLLSAVFEKMHLQKHSSHRSSVTYNKKTYGFI